MRRRQKVERGIWPTRFWEYAIRDKGYYEHHVDDIYYKPDKHGQVTRAPDWPYSNFHQAVFVTSE